MRQHAAMLGGLDTTTLLREDGAAHAPMPMIVLGLVMAGTYFLIATGRLHKLTAALLGAVLCTGLGLALGVLKEYPEVYSMLAKDINVLGVIVGTSILVDIAGSSGLFQFLAIKIAKRAKGQPKKLFTALVVLTVLFVSVLTIAPGTLIVVSLGLVLTRTLELNARPYLVAIALAANSGALVTFASGICTLMVGSAANIPYGHFFIVSTPAAILTAFVVWFVVGRMYRNELGGAGETPEVAAEREAKIMSFDEWAMVKDRRVFRRSAWILAATVVGFATAQQVGVGLDYVAMAGGTAALLFSGQEPEAAIRKVNWTVILFFIGLFVMIGVVEHTGLLEVMAEGMTALSSGNIYAALSILVVFTAVTSGIMDNIPVAATMIPIVRNMVNSGLQAEPLWWGLVLSANLGGNGTPIGSISCVIALHALSESTGKKVGWGEWFKVGGTTLGLQVVIILVYLLLFTAFNLFPSLGGS